MTTKSPRVRALLRQAQRTADAGKRAAAEQLYRQILEEEPQTAEAWLGLAQVIGDMDERESALRRVLQLDPQNDEARLLLGEDEPATAADGEFGSERAFEGDDPFSQSRAWLNEATAGQRRQRVDGEGAAAGRQPAAARPTTVELSTPSKTTARPLPEAGTPAAASAASEQEVMYCYRHPDRETGLRCITCNRPICTRCAQHTPVGYRCPQCIREAQDVFFSANALDYVVTGVVTLILALVAGAIAPRLGFFVIFIGPAAGTLIGRLAFRVARRRHGRYLPEVVAAMVALGGLLPTALPVLLGVLLGAASLGSLGFGLLWPIVYVFLATGAAYYQVK